MHLGAGLSGLCGATSLRALVVAAVACSPAKPQPVAPPPPTDTLVVPYKRVDNWRYVDLSRAPTPVDVQLKRYFQRVFTHAQFSAPHACVAREFANFREKHAAAPDEELETEMWGRCGAAGAGEWMTQDYYSDGTLLDSPLSEEVLRDVTARLTADLKPFTVFGITARYLGPNVAFVLQTGAPDATLHIDEADADGNVHLRGRVLGDFSRVRALINQGEAAIADCEPDSREVFPEYGFDCKLAPGDQQAWLALTGFGQGTDNFEIPLLFRPAHAAGSAPPTDYQRHRLALPEQTDTRDALLTVLNQLRRKLDRQPLQLASAQSQFNQSAYREMFSLHSRDDYENDSHLVAQMLRGDLVEGAVTWGRVVSGMAHDGDAADWLAFRLLLPVSREPLMAATAHQFALATQGDPAIGFGAAATVYSVATPEQEKELTDILTAAIAKRRGNRATRIVANPPELVALTTEIASGNEAPEAFLTALRVSNLKAHPPFREGVLVPMNSSSDEFAASLDDLLQAEKLEYGVIVKHVRLPDEPWAAPLAFIWFSTSARPQVEARRRQAPPQLALK